MDDGRRWHRRFGAWVAAGSMGILLAWSPAWAQQMNLAGMQLWNADYWQTTLQGDYYGPNYEIKKLRPISLAGCRNGKFSGHVVVTSSNAPLPGLKATMTDLVNKQGDKIPASRVRIRYAELARSDTSWSAPFRFERLLDKPPEEVKMVDLRSWRGWAPKYIGPVATQPVWVTVSVPAGAKPGDYEGRLSIRSDLNKVRAVPVKIRVADWALPDPRDLRVTNFGQSSPESLARHYDVPRWSEKHFELMGKSMAQMTEVNSRQAIIDLCIDFYGLGGVPETMVRWIRQPDGPYKHDFTIVDKYLETVAKYMGKPTLLRVNCWKEWGRKPGSKPGAKVKWWTPCRVSSLDPGTGKVEPLDQPAANTPEFLAFWKPVLDELRKKIEARGWFDVTAFGANSYCWGVNARLVDTARQIWPDGKWSYTGHNGSLGGRFKGSDKKVWMPCLHADTIWGHGKLARGNYHKLLKPRPGFHCFTFRGWRCSWALTAQRRIPEEEITRGHDGVSDFGVDFFPVRTTRRRFYSLGCGAGTGGPRCSTLALLSPAPDGPSAGNERFEALREGLQIAEAILFIQKGLDGGKLPGELAARARAVLDERCKRLMDSFVLADKSGKKRFDPRIYMADAEARENTLFQTAAEVATAQKK